MEGPQSVWVQVDGRRFLSFCSNDYLGLANDAAVVEAFIEGARQYGVGSGASMMVSGYSLAHQALEEAFASFLQRERALLFTNGYLANLSVMQALMGSKDCIYQDKLNHASLLDAAQLSAAPSVRYRHLDLSHLRRLLEKPILGKRWVVTDHIFSMTGERAPLRELKALCEEYEAYLVVDDAHGVGIFKDLLPADVLITPLGKAFGGLGAVVAASSELIETLLQFARTYIFTTALPSAMAVAMTHSLSLIQNEPERGEKLKANIAHFREEAVLRGLFFQASDTPIQALILKENERVMQVAESLFDRGFWLGAIRPPAVPVNTARLRLTLSALHSFEQIDSLLDAIQDVLQSSPGGTSSTPSLFELDFLPAEMVLATLRNSRPENLIQTGNGDKESPFVPQGEKKDKKTKPDLVLLPGWGFGCDIFQTFSAFLSPHFKVHLLELPGFASQPFLGREEDLDAWVAALKPQIPEQAWLCGWSFGGLLALKLLSEGVGSGATLLASSPCWLAQRSWPGVTENILQSFMDTCQQDFKAALKKFAFFQAPEVYRSMLPAFKAQKTPHPSLLQAGLSILKNTDLRSLPISQPLQIILGAKDAILPVEALVPALQKLWPQAELEVLPGLGHMAFWQNPSLIADKILAFQATLSALRAGKAS